MNLDDIFSEVAALRQEAYQSIWPDDDQTQCRCEDCTEYDNAEDREYQP